MSKGTISDTRVKLRPSKELLSLLNENKAHINEMPENIVNALKLAGFNVNVQVEILNENLSSKLPTINTDLLSKICKETSVEASLPLPIKTITAEEEEEENKTSENNQKHAALYLNDLIWLNKILKHLRENHGCKLYLHNLLEKCELILPENAKIERNPELEARCQRLRADQQNKEYMKMTKNVDAALKNLPEDTIAFQLKSLNSQMIAVLQFVISVITGFVFGFIGIPLLSGNMDVGSRLMLGIFCAIIVAIAEIYFLTKKLNEYDDTVTTMNKHQSLGKKSSTKTHVD